jgi:hypothetical protein
MGENLTHSDKTVGRFLDSDEFRTEVDLTKELNRMINFGANPELLYLAAAVILRSR